MTSKRAPSRLREGFFILVQAGSLKYRPTVSKGKSNYVGVYNLWCIEYMI